MQGTLLKRPYGGPAAKSRGAAAWAMQGTAFATGTALVAATVPQPVVNGHKISMNVQASRLTFCEELLVAPEVDELLVDDELPASTKVCRIDSCPLSELLLDESCEFAVEPAWLAPWPP